MINVAEIIQDPDFCKPYTLYRKTTVLVGGRPRTSEKDIQRSGVIIAATSKDLLQVPEGDRVKGIIAVYDTEDLLVTNEKGTSDNVDWNGERYRLFQLWPRKANGFYKALGERIAGD
ncbi:hypothetical protein [Sporomusa sp. KB1]|jgi:hypothetical protein|uniref:hypothetical protein n=1 Tax=Sporomusa sp. KB1 TaxID=943346 RepID=UPI0011A5BF4F|nr:hypothetical protein [Sporomusa sp. KB1]TWH46336.1 hypothetical protein Salpa_2317 [Sporomusa sp. KB1]